MPFEIPQQEPIIKKKFAHLADALLRGCAVTKPHKFSLGEDGYACAVGAIAIGLGRRLPKRFEAMGWEVLYGDEADNMDALYEAYKLRYGCYPPDDNDDGRFTREQIAERIRAL